MAEISELAVFYSYIVTQFLTLLKYLNPTSAKSLLPISASACIDNAALSSSVPFILLVLCYLYHCHHCFMAVCELIESKLKKISKT